MNTTVQTETAAQEAAAKEFAKELQADVIVLELKRHHISKSRRLTKSQEAAVANMFDSETDATTTNKKLFPKGDKRIQKINTHLTRALECYYDMTAYYEKGRRLIRQDQLQLFTDRIDAISQDLVNACSEADVEYESILESARQYLGDELFDRSNYPQRFVGSCGISWSTHNFKPDERLLKLAPETYQRECDRVRRMFESAVEKFEAEAAENLGGLVSKMVSVLETAENDTGKRIVFKEAAANNLRDFFDRFQTLNMTNNPDLIAVVDEAKAVLGDTKMATLKKNALQRRDMKAKMEQIGGKLNDLLVTAPARSIDLDDLDD